MNKLFLTSSSQAVGYEKYGKILWPIVIILGWVLNKIFYFLKNVLPFPEKGSVAVAITILTILIYMCLLPLTYRQQKFSILSKKMQPEISKIREKYQNRKDQASMVAMQEETQAVYDKYGISMMGSCLQLFIQMPILFALYRVFYNISDFIIASDDAYRLFNLTIQDNPWALIKSNLHSNIGVVIVALLFPVFSYLSQVINMKVAQTNTDPNDPTMAQMRTMNLMMPLMSGFIAFTVPVGLSFYWIIGAVVRTVQQVILNKHFEKIDLADLIEANKEKAAKKAEKRGIRRAQIYNAANMSTKNKLSDKANYVNDSVDSLEKANDMRKNARKGSLASKANLVNDFNNNNKNKNK